MAIGVGGGPEADLLLDGPGTAEAGPGLVLDFLEGWSLLVGIRHLSG